MFLCPFFCILTLFDMAKSAEYFVSGDLVQDPNTGHCYTIKSLLGRGAFAQVFLVSLNDQNFALKVIDHQSVTKKGLLEKIDFEVSLHRKLVHNHIVRLHSDFRTQRFVFLLMEHCVNGSLDHLLKKRRPKVCEVRQWTRQACEAVLYMHNDHCAVHRDLKLGNLFLDSSYNVKVGDFGLAALVTNGKKRTLCGTPNYIAPEVLFDKASGHGLAVDIWALGVILYTLLTGVPPFQTQSVKAIYAKIASVDFAFPSDFSGPRYARDLIMWALGRDPNTRPTAEQFLKHKFFHREMNTVESMAYHLETQSYKEIKLQDIHLTSLNDRYSCSSNDQFDIHTSNYITNTESNIYNGNINILTTDTNIFDYCTLVLPVASARAVGYALASGTCGMYTADGINLSINKQKQYTALRKQTVNGRTVVRKENLGNAVSEHLAGLAKALEDFRRNYCRDLKIFDIESTHVLKIKKVHGALVVCCHNGIMQIDFPDSQAVVIADMGTKLGVLRGSMTQDLRKRALQILNTIK